MGAGSNGNRTNSAAPATGHSGTGICPGSLRGHGGNAVAEWVGSVDEGAVRFTRDVDILVRRDDMPAAIEAMAAGGFVHDRAMGVEIFLDSPDSKPGEAVHVNFAGEKVKEYDLQSAPLIEESVRPGTFAVVNLDALVGMKLTSYRDKDKRHIRDMIGVGLIDHSWLERVLPSLAPRLEEILNLPEG